MTQPTAKPAKPVAYYSFPHVVAFHGPKVRAKTDENVAPAAGAAAAAAEAKKPLLIRQVSVNNGGQAAAHRQHVLVPPQRLGLKPPVPGLYRALQEAANRPPLPERRLSGCEE